jgi:ribosomal protein S18 acetylase RimI-like enzyme
MMTDLALDIKRIDPQLEVDLAALFREIKASGDQLRFHPHSFDDETAHWIANYAGLDLYFGATYPGQRGLVGYGMLRGWDAGYDVPSLGIIIGQQARGRGLSKALMSFLHAAARDRGCSRIRLKVYRDNVVALELYKQLGYVFGSEEAGQLVGMATL